MKIRIWNVFLNNFWVRDFVVKRLIKLRGEFYDEMQKAVIEAGSQLSYIVADDFNGLGVKCESGAIGVHDKSLASGKCTAYCHAINELQLAICEIRGDPESHWRQKDD